MSFRSPARMAWGGRPHHRLPCTGSADRTCTGGVAPTLALRVLARPRRVRGSVSGLVRSAHGLTPRQAFASFVAQRARRRLRRARRIRRVGLRRKALYAEGLSAIVADPSSIDPGLVAPPPPPNRGGGGAPPPPPAPGAPPAASPRLRRPRRRRSGGLAPAPRARGARPPLPPGVPPPPPRFPPPGRSRCSIPWATCRTSRTRRGGSRWWTTGSRAPDRAVVRSRAGGPARRRPSGSRRPPTPGRPSRSAVPARVRGGSARPRCARPS